jgi:hypothetical protein
MSLCHSKMSLPLCSHWFSKTACPSNPRYNSPVESKRAVSFTSSAPLRQPRGEITSISMRFDHEEGERLLSTYQHINISTYQHINISTYQHIKQSQRIKICENAHRVNERASLISKSDPSFPCIGRFAETRQLSILNKLDCQTEWSLWHCDTVTLWHCDTVTLWHWETNGATRLRR